MHGQTARTRPGGGTDNVVLRQNATVPGVLESKQSGSGEIWIIRFDGFFQGREGQAAIVCLDDRLRLDRTEHGRATGFVFVGMRLHANQVFVAALTVCEQGNKVGLSPAWHEQSALETKVGSEPLLEGDDAWILAIDIVAQRRGGHRGTHRRGWSGHGIAAQIDVLHGRPGSC